MDLQIRAISHKHNVKISIVDISESVKEICDLQGANPLISYCLAKFTVANALIALDNKSAEKINTNYITSQGAIKKIITEFHNNKIRAYAQVKDFDLEEYIKSVDSNPLYATMGHAGQLLQTRDMGLKDPYISTINTTTPNIDQIFMEFLKDSNQVGSLIATDIRLDQDLNIEKSVGILIQLLPGHSSADVDLLAEKIGNTRHLCEVLLASTNYYEVIKEIINDAQILETKKISFECTCNDDKILDSIKLLGNQEINQIIADSEAIEVKCEFCNKQYVVTPEELNELIY